METLVDNDSWQAEAPKLRAQGKDADEIAALTGKAPSAVREALRGTESLADDDVRSLGAGRAELTVPHTPRRPRAILDQAMVRSAAADFAAGKIDRAELLRRITR
jgi:hypothetical protein